LDITNIKTLLGITDTDNDSILSHIGDVVTAEVKAYCRIPTIADDLQLIINDMVIDRYRARGYGQETAPQTLKSISEGDVSMQFDTVQYNPTMELTDAEKKRLAPYRKLWL
jgi:hypothetical protein